MSRTGAVVRLRVDDDSMIGRSTLAFLMKASAAALSLLMFMALARAMPPSQFGRFAFAFALSTLLSLVAGLGQRLLVLRYLPIYASDGQDPARRGLLRAGYAAITVVALVTALVCGIIAAAFAGVGWYVGACGPLILAMTLSDYQSGVLRAMGMLGRALIPRDILWRLVVIVACLPAILGIRNLPFGAGMSAATGIILSGTVLLALFVAQAVSHRDLVHDLFGRNTVEYRIRPWARTSWGLWANGLVQTGSEQLAVVLLGIALTPAESGGLFASIKAALLLNFFLLAANLVSAPRIARLWHENQIARLQRVSASITLFAAVPTVAIFIAYIVLGHSILGLFGGHYAHSYPSLLVLSAAQVVNALSGQTGVMMTMTGHERRLLLFATISNVVPLALLVPGVRIYGEFFGACAFAVGLASWNIMAVIWTRRRLGIDTSIVGAVATLLRRGGYEHDSAVYSRSAEVCDNEPV